jgi:hypothetical protein
MRASAPIILAAGLAAALCLLASSCSMPGASTPSASSPPAVQLTDYSGSFSYTVDAGSSAKDVYFVFSNTSVSTSTTGATVKVGSDEAIGVDGVDIATTSAQPALGPSSAPANAKDMLALSNRDIRAYLAKKGATFSASAEPRAAAPSYDVAGTTTGSLFDLDKNDNSASVAATCRSVTTASTAQGNRTLNIWVANNCWTATGTVGTIYPAQPHLVTQAMVDALAEEFLKAGENNDIYDWVTTILGPEWETTTDGSLIPFNNEITILLSDIEQDLSDTGGIVGYFWAVNNFRKAVYSDSNERIMFVIDAAMFSNPSSDGSASTTNSGWSASSYWAKKCFSTLAHEFQHMIQFYRKGIKVRGDGDTADTWINEMCSQLIEDLVADKIGVEGPRGVDPSLGGAGPSGNTNGRIPYFNKYLSSNYSLSKDRDYNVYDYSFSYAFGSWLARNFGGASFVKNVVYDYNIDSTCITDAVASGGGSWTLSDLISRWAVAVLGSTRTDMPFGYRYNTGGWTSSSLGGLTYNLGSINFFNYSPAPTVKTSLDAGNSMATTSNTYFLAATGLTGSKTWKLKVPSGVTFSVYVTQ